MKAVFLGLILCVLLLDPAAAANRVATGADFNSFVNNTVNQPALRGSSWSILIHSLSGDSAVYQWDPDRRLIPASVAKIVTSASALDGLGPDYRFTTTLSSTAQIDNEGRLRGDLVVQAGGDPVIDPRHVDSLGAPVLVSWARRLRASGIRRIEGNLVMRTWPYRLQVSSPDWEVGDVNDRFGPSMDGFGFNSNVCQVAILPGPVVGAGAQFTVDPPYTPLQIRSSVITAPAGTEPSISFRLVPEDSIVYISGETPVNDDGEYLWIAVQNPALFFGRAFHAALLREGIQVAGGVIVDRSPGAAAGNVLHTHRSPPLSRVIKLMNKESDNFTSEYVLRALGARVNKSGDQRSGLRAQSRFLHEIGVNESGIYLRDGCGLARQDLCSARGVVEVLKAMYVHPASDAYINSMAISGVDGTISFRLSSPQMAGKVRAKTGTINHVSNLAGYLFADNGQVYLFAILCNNFPTGRRQAVRAAQDAILERLYAASVRNFSTTDR